MSQDTKSSLFVVVFKVDTLVQLSEFSRAGESCFLHVTMLFSKGKGKAEGLAAKEQERSSNGGRGEWTPMDRVQSHQPGPQVHPSG